MKAPITRLAASIGVPMAILRRELVKDGYLDEKFAATPRAIATGAVTYRRVQAKCAEGEVDMKVWDGDKIQAVLKRARRKQKTSGRKHFDFRNRHHTEDLICDHVWAVRDLLVKKTIDERLEMEMRSAYFHDPHFLGGPAFINLCGTPEQVDAVFSKLDDFFVRAQAFLKPGKQKKFEEIREISKAGRIWTLRQVGAATPGP